ncbi:MAG: DUF5009 domain-containing protein [Bacteroidetes bacterium]|nr:DUF5009 domain-containing protein [Bacteroidota bacterium]
MLQLPRRLQSIDVFRAITMFFMIFVNDVDGVEKIPEWIKHVSINTDGLGFADTIFPAFLFIVGLSIPFALNKRIQSGDSQQQIASHIVLRSLALIIMGVFHVNLENYSNKALIPYPIFEILVTLAFFLIWIDYQPSISKTKERVLQISGIIFLFILAALYKGEENDHIVWMRHQWWGILGLIGWAYLTCSFVYLFSKGKLFALIAALVFFIVYNILNQTSILEPVAEILDKLWFLNNGSEATLIMSGVVISAIYSKSLSTDSKNFFTILLLTGVFMIVFGFMLRPLGGISKIRATPSWTCICAGISILVFVILIFIVDTKSKGKWFNIIKPAGTSTLTCYLIPYFLYSFMMLFNINYPFFLNEGIGGIIRSFSVAFIVIFITGLFEKKLLRLKI